MISLREVTKLEVLPRIGDAVKVTKQMELAKPKETAPAVAGWGRRMCIRTYLM